MMRARQVPDCSLLAVLQPALQFAGGGALSTRSAVKSHIEQLVRTHDDLDLFVE